MDNGELFVFLLLTASVLDPYPSSLALVAFGLLCVWVL